MLIRHLAAKEAVHTVFQNRVIASGCEMPVFRAVSGKGSDPIVREFGQTNHTLSRCQTQVCGRCHNGAVENTTPVPKQRGFAYVREIFPKGEFRMRKQKEYTKGYI
jgi:hypothetical protein